MVAVHCFLLSHRLSSFSEIQETGEFPRPPPIVVGGRGRGTSYGKIGGSRGFFSFGIRDVLVCMYVYVCMPTSVQRCQHPLFVCVGAYSSVSMWPHLLCLFEVFFIFTPHISFVFPPFQPHHLLFAGASLLPPRLSLSLCMLSLCFSFVLQPLTFFTEAVSFSPSPQLLSLHSHHSLVLILCFLYVPARASVCVCAFLFPFFFPFGTLQLCFEFPFSFSVVLLPSFRLTCDVKSYVCVRVAFLLLCYKKIPLSHVNCFEF